MKKMDDEQVKKPHKYNQSQDGSNVTRKHKAEMSKHTPKIPPEPKNTWNEMKSHPCLLLVVAIQGNTPLNETKMY